ncbi:hypothetical protein [Streptomyces phage Verabelle]|uniref:Uncharacterized protein n=1 Tax=Streptomyces phage Verabelle TaxID=3065247 RepID=A0AA50F1J2_9CAUD|nr:hypothetical protein [Streptomyces phage Verabelle]
MTQLRKASFLDHSFEISIACLHLLSAATIALNGFQLQATPTVTMGVWSLGPIFAGFLLGGLAMIVGPSWRGVGHVGRAIERAGLYVIIAAWVNVLMIVAIIEPSLLPGVLAQAVVIIVGCVGRAAALRRVDRAVEHVAAVAAYTPKD